MRFVELRPAEDRPSIAFHPRLTVLQGVDTADLESFVALARALADGYPPPWFGTVEVDGTTSDIQTLPCVVPPGAQVELVVTLARLNESAAASATKSSSGGEMSAAAEALQTTVDELAAELAGADAVHADLVEQLRAAQAAVRLDAGPALDEAEAELRRAARRLDVDPFVSAPDADARRERLQKAVTRCDEALAGLAVGDRAVVASAIATHKASLTSGATMSPEAAALAELWESLHDRLDGLESRLEATGGGTEEVAERVESARASFRSAESASTPKQMTAEDSAEIERLHDEMIEYREKAMRGVRRGSARNKMHEIHEELLSRLESFGYPSWTAYRMSNGRGVVDPESMAEFEQATAELEQAEAEWNELMSRLEDDSELSSVLDAIDQVYARATELLGAGADAEIDPAQIAQRLRELTIDGASLGVDPDDARSHLLATLDDAGAIGHHDVLADGAVVGLADSWLEVLRTADDAAVRLVRERDRAAEELDWLAAHSALTGDDPLASERAAMIAAEDAVAELCTALVDKARIRRELHGIIATELAIAENHDAKLELLDATRSMAALGAGSKPTPPSGVEAHVCRGPAGPIPLLVDLGADATPEELAVLLSAAEDVQLIGVSGGPSAAAWVKELDTANAALVDLAAIV